MRFKRTLTALIIVFSILSIFAKSYPYFIFDPTVSQFIQSFKTDFLDLLMVFISELGNSPGRIILVVLIFIAFYIFKKRQEALMVFLSSIGITLISDLVKTVVGRPRPDPQIVIQMADDLRLGSFPSGHVLFFIGLFGFLVFLTVKMVKKPLFKKALMVFFITLIILIGLSRIYLGAHWASDVLGAYLLGTIWLYFMVNLYKKISIKK